MPSLIEVFPDAKTLLALEPEELGPVALEVIQSGRRGEEPFQLSFLCRAIERADPQRWPGSLRVDVDQAVAEALGWLERVGLIIPAYGPMMSAGSWVLTRRGKAIRTREAVNAYKDAMFLPEGLAHPAILERTQSAFLRGDYDIAVFAAFKAVEVAVRNAGGFPEGELGTALMRKAFHSETGPLTDKTAVSAERQAEGSLFAGAIGAAKNPASHRDVEMSKVEAARLIMFASYLMSIVDERANRAMG